MGFRNVLIHLYIETDDGQSYKAIQDELGSSLVISKHTSTSNSVRAVTSSTP